MKKLAAAILLLLLPPATSSANYFQGSAQPALNLETVTANLASTSFTIPANFVCLSQEFGGAIPGPPELLTPTNTNLISLLSMLGPNGVIRIGGSSQDVAPFSTSLNSTIASHINGFIAALGSGWSINYGLDGKANDPSKAATQAGLILGAISNSKVAFNFMNEPDLYGLTQGQVQSRWNSYYSSVSTAFPSANLTAIDLANNPTASSVNSYISGLTPGLSGLQYATSHYYPNISQSLTVGQIIASATGLNFASYQSAFPNKYFITESNISASTPQTNTVLKGLVGALWYLNTTMAVAAAGVQGFCLHGNSVDLTWFTNPFFYQSSDSGFLPSALFNGMFLFSKVEGQQIVSTSLSGSANVTAQSTKGAGGNANILAVNNDTVSPVDIVPAQSNSWSTATVLVLAPSKVNNGCLDTTPTLGSAPIGENGTWGGSSYTINNGDHVRIYPCGATLIKIQP